MAKDSIAFHLESNPEARRLREILLAHCLSVTRSYLYTWPERALTVEEKTCFLTLLKKYQQGIPLAYLLGEVDFCGLPLNVTPDVLIPRPDSETLVSCALALPDSEKPWQVADLGTGSGALALALAKARPQWQLLASDLSEAALAVARGNAKKLKIENVSFVHGDWDAAWPADFSPDLIVSNPPYVAAGEWHWDLTFEPRLALVAGETGLECYPQLIALTLRQKKSCWLVLEHGFQQGELLHALLQKHGFEKIATHADLAGHPRVTLGFWPYLKISNG
jgi:release factor glutamine methyltransferase